MFEDMNDGKSKLNKLFKATPSSVLTDSAIQTIKEVNKTLNTFHFLNLNLLFLYLYHSQYN